MANWPLAKLNQDALVSLAKAFDSVATDADSYVNALRSDAQRALTGLTGRRLHANIGVLDHNQHTQPWSIITHSQHGSASKSYHLKLFKSRRSSELQATAAITANSAAQGARVDHLTATVSSMRGSMLLRGDAETDAQGSSYCAAETSWVPRKGTSLSSLAGFKWAPSACGEASGPCWGLACQAGMTPTRLTMQVRFMDDPEVQELAASISKSMGHAVQVKGACTALQRKRDAGLSLQCEVCVALRGCPGTDVGGATAAESQPGAIVHGIDNLITNASNKNTADMFVRWQPTGAWLVRLQLSCGDVAASMHPLQEWDTVVANRGWGNL